MTPNTIQKKRRKPSNLTASLTNRIASTLASGGRSVSLLLAWPSSHLCDFFAAFLGKFLGSCFAAEGSELFYVHENTKSRIKIGI